MFPLVGTLIIVTIHEDIEVDLGFLNVFVYFVPECHFVKLALDNLVQSLGRSIGLRMPDFCSRVGSSKE